MLGFLLAISSQNVFGQTGIYLDGDQYPAGYVNSSNRGTADVSGGLLDNRSATITKANVSNGGRIDNYLSGTIIEANISNGGTVENGIQGAGRGFIITANVSDGGSLIINHLSTVTTVNMSGGEMFSNGTITEANISGGEVRNTAIITEANISGGSVNNEQYGIISEAIISGGYVDNNGTITEMNVSGGGYVNNVGSDGTIGTANVSDGFVSNLNGGTIDYVEITGGGISNHGIITEMNATGGDVDNKGTINQVSISVTGSLFGSWGAGQVTNSFEGTIDEVNVSGGRFQNYLGGTVGVVNVSSGLLNGQHSVVGEVWNMDGGTITELNVTTGGRVENHSGGIIDNAVMTGGMVSNGGLIKEMAYSNGTYNGHWINHRNERSDGTLNNLILADNSANNTGDWGTVNSLGFVDGGVLNLFGTYVDSTLSVTNAIMAGDVNLEAASLMLWFGAPDDLAKFLNPGVNTTILFADLLGVDALDVTGGEFLASFGVGVEGGTSSMLYNDGVFATGWSFADSFSGLKYTSGNIEPPPAAVPEPATVLMLGLGLAGAGLAARRKRMRNEK